MTSEQTRLVDIENDTSNYDSRRPSERLAKPTPLPKLQLFSLFYIQFGEPITATVIFPFVVQLVRDTGITGGDEAKTGYFAGFLESVFFLAEALTVLGWGYASDRVGRKPPLLFGTLGLAAAITSFGLCKSFWPLVLSRCVQGMFNGNIGITKSVISEITDSSNIAQAFALIPLMWGTGMTFGPVIGGVLSHPADRWPQTFGKVPFFCDYPYFLPCAVVAMVPLSAFVFATLFLKETLASAVTRRRQKGEEANSDAGQSPESTDLSVTTDEQSPPPLRSLMTRRVMVPLINYAFFVFVDQCFNVLNPLVYATPIAYGGLGLSSFTIGIIMSAVGIIIGCVPVFFFPPFLRTLGIYRLYRTAFPCYLVIFASFPLMNALARRAGRVDGLIWVVLVVQLSCCILTIMNYICLFIYFSDSAPNKAALGAINGLAQTIASSVRIFAPLTASSLFSFSQQHNVLGGTMVYWILCAFVIVGIYISSQLPRRLQSKEV